MNPDRYSWMLQADTAVLVAVYQVSPEQAEKDAAVEELRHRYTAHYTPPPPEPEPAEPKTDWIIWLAVSVLVISAYAILFYFIISLIRT